MLADKTPSVFATPQRTKRQLGADNSMAALTPSASLVVELRRQLREAQYALEDRERDLQLSAEIGQSLLENNEQLKQQYEQLMTSQSIISNTIEPISESSESTYDPLLVQVSTQSAQNLALKLQTLECAHIDLQSQYEAALLDLRKSEESDRQARASLKRLEASHDSLQSAIQELSGELESMQLDKKRLQCEKTDLLSKIQELETTALHGGSGSASAYSNTLNKLRVAEQQLESLSSAYQDLVRQRDIHATTAADLQLRLEETETMVEEYRSYRDENEQLKMLADQIQSDLEQSREYAQTLRARLAVLSPSLETGEYDQGSKTLLSEVDDQRIHLQDINSHLESRHASLVQVHSMSLHHQQRMKLHIARLSQVAGQQSSESRIRHLEQALAQTDSEKKELQIQVAKLERVSSSARLRSDEDFLLAQLDHDKNTIHNKTHSDAQMTDFIADLNKVIATLHLRVEQGDNEVSGLKRELHTLQLMKGAETDRAAKLRDELVAQCSQNDQLRVTTAQLAYELDTLKLNIEKKPIDEVVEEKPVLIHDSPAQAFSNDSLAELNRPVSFQEHADEDQTQNADALHNFQESIKKNHDLFYDTPLPDCSSPSFETAASLQPSDVRKSVIDRSKVNECNQQ
ncbi:hypothetical protein BATDEDRAFT_90547 [Batrachochytrium dendrobatidis JAM81]|uniref:Uncharacterized protein n=2 Tax=Batrachochytrium dendrobatidis TaxID=109871 RepID=F4P7V8_BATDJ|nr:uncharacterized protein BATDEDRAFT_90547 [Batrachochytrium dendrobatidis JAM81]EGF78731.1 hypothetical protein BATDEDRAFT_90547 [Batrachochytrium dendrobatidis JAM81]OAJ43702.1 hypothetical protein BDEG_27033 [Batrachochytrium dendrobatidis JEL423]|eukprot:XP_006680955.1 hypothetical protein BATDEDRAFT_90547 [Batrachochytrium dendrobatidis JAM81]